MTGSLFVCFPVSSGHRQGFLIYPEWWREKKCFTGFFQFCFHMWRGCWCGTRTVTGKKTLRIDWGQVQFSESSNKLENMSAWFSELWCCTVIGKDLGSHCVYLPILGEGRLILNSLLNLDKLSWERVPQLSKPNRWFRKENHISSCACPPYLWMGTKGRCEQFSWSVTGGL